LGILNLHPPLGDAETFDNLSTRGCIYSFRKGKEKVVKKQAITLGIRSEEDESVEVLEGVDLNEKIIIGVNLELKENQRVEVSKDEKKENQRVEVYEK